VAVCVPCRAGGPTPGVTPWLAELPASLLLLLLLLLLPWRKHGRIDRQRRTAEAPGAARQAAHHHHHHHQQGQARVDNAAVVSPRGRRTLPKDVSIWLCRRMYERAWPRSLREDAPPRCHCCVFTATDAAAGPPPVSGPFAASYAMMLCTTTGGALLLHPTVIVGRSGQCGSIRAGERGDAAPLGPQASSTPRGAHTRSQVGSRRGP
jgi:hypothetical protein